MAILLIFSKNLVPSPRREYIGNIKGDFSEKMAIFSQLQIAITFLIFKIS